MITITIKNEQDLATYTDEYYAVPEEYVKVVVQLLDILVHHPGTTVALHETLHHKEEDDGK